MKWIAYPALVKGWEMVITCAHEFGMDIYATDVIDADFNSVEHNFA